MNNVDETKPNHGTPLVFTSKQTAFIPNLVPQALSMIVCVGEDRAPRSKRAHRARGCSCLGPNTIQEMAVQVAYLVNAGPPLRRHHYCAQVCHRRHDPRRVQSAAARLEIRHARHDLRRGIRDLIAMSYR
eukprot:scaffold112698_cov24-Prasinocladus_malaysianus.AAC.1